MKRVPLLFPFCIASLFALFSSALLPLPLLPFSPFLALLYQRTSFAKSLWIAALCGLIIDILSSDLHFGLQALAFSLTTLVLYSQRRHFFEDKPLSISLFTAAISLVSTAFLWVLIPLSGSSIHLTLSLVATDLMIMPITDGLYAFCFFYVPLILYASIAKTGWRALIHKWTMKKENAEEESPS